MEFEFNGNKYRLGDRLNAMEQFHVCRRLGIVSFDEEEDRLAVFSERMYSMTDVDVDYCFNKLLGCLELLRSINNVEVWEKVRSNGVCNHATVNDSMQTTIFLAFKCLSIYMEMEKIRDIEGVDVSDSGKKLIT